MKQNESVLNVLMYLFHHHMDKENPIDLSNMKIIDDLKSAGFHAHIIGKAFRWLHHLIDFADQPIKPSEHSFRIYNEYERQLLDDECRHFIFSLEQQEILTPHAREIVIHLAIELAYEGIDLHLLKWVVLMVLFNLPKSEKALAHMEFLVLSSDNPSDTMH